MEQIVKTAVGVFIGGLAAVFAYEQITEFRTDAALKKLNQDIAAATQKVNADNAERQRLAQEQKRNAIISQAKEERQRYEASSLDAGRRDEADKAFKRFYKPTAACVADPVQTVCANAHIIAKREFEATYKHPY